MRKILAILSLCVLMVITFCACEYTSNKKYSEDDLEAIKLKYEKYLDETYPGENFTVKVWQEYTEDIGGAGLPDYKGNVIRHIVTDSKGNRFRIFQDGSKFSDDYKKVLDGDVYYNEKGQHVHYDDDGNVLFEDYY